MVWSVHYLGNTTHEAKYRAANSHSLGWRLQHVSSMNLPEVCIALLESPAFCAQFLIRTLLLYVTGSGKRGHLAQ